MAAPTRSPLNKEALLERARKLEARIASDIKRLSANPRVNREDIQILESENVELRALSFGIEVIPTDLEVIDERLSAIEDNIEAKVNEIEQKLVSTSNPTKGTEQPTSSRPEPSTEQPTQEPTQEPTGKPTGTAAPSTPARLTTEA